MAADFHRDYLVRLPLPLAQLYSRAHNAKDPRSRHDHAYYLFEALVKLAAAPLIATYQHEVRDRAPRVVAIDRLLARLALPSLGHWVDVLRSLARHFGERVDAADHPLGHVRQQLDEPRRDLPGVLALYRRIKDGPDQPPSGDQYCTLLQLLEVLVRYRNAVFGHGGPRLESFYVEDMGPLLIPAASEILAEGVLDLLGPAGSRLVYLTELRIVDAGRVEVGLRELVGLQGERLAPLTLPRAQAEGLLPNLVAVLWPGRPFPLRLDPLLAYRESETAAEVLFLNRDRSGRHVEYLSYTTGRTERDRIVAQSVAAWLGAVLNPEASRPEPQDHTDPGRPVAPSAGQAQAAPPSPTAHLIDDYEVVGEIGRGGMGVVYLARQLSLGRLVAVKVLPASLAADEVALARFRREVRHLASCDHPHIVKVLASGTTRDGRLYYAMEYVPGCDLEMVWRELAGPGTPAAASTLGQRTWARAVVTANCRQHEQAAGRSSAPAAQPNGEARSAPELPDGSDDPGGYVRLVVGLVRDAALALQAVHDQGIVHRDVKPANLVLTRDSTRVVLMDFGLAKGHSLTLSASRRGGLLGTLRYGQFLLTAAGSGPYGLDTTARVWEVKSGRLVYALRGHRGGLTGATFSPDGKAVVTASEDGTARVYSCELCGPIGELIRLAQTRVTRQLTAEERVRYLHE